MDLTNPQIVMRDREIAQLKEELAKERKRAETRELALDAAVSSSCVLGAELAAAQASIARMREALFTCTPEGFCDFDSVREALSVYERKEGK